jgi:hypothetical protein
MDLPSKVLLINWYFLAHLTFRTGFENWTRLTSGQNLEFGIYYFLSPVFPAFPPSTPDPESVPAIEERISVSDLMFSMR